MNEELQNELTWAFGILIGFIIFLLLGGINAVSEIAISVGVFVFSWTVMSFFLKKYGSNDEVDNRLEKEIKWFSAILIIFLTIMTVIGMTDSELELTYSLYATLVLGYTLIWIIRSSAIKYFN
jgi:Mn2+/Fe2+ NRAMP family transporter